MRLDRGPRGQPLGIAQGAPGLPLIAKPLRFSSP
jgi:hypothetical protein